MNDKTITIVDSDNHNHSHNLDMRGIRSIDIIRNNRPIAHIDNIAMLSIDGVAYLLANGYTLRAR
jgi:hypothetical protein